MKKISSLFKKKLIWQVISVLLIVLIPAFLACGYWAFSRAETMCLQNEEEDLTRASNYISGKVESNKNLEWLLSYWSENSDTLNEGLIYDDKEYLDILRDEFYEMNPTLSDLTLKPSELKTLSDDSKRLYAQICMLDLVLEFDGLKESYGLKYIYLSKIISADEEMFLISGLKEGEKRGDKSPDIFRLGHIGETAFDSHPVLYDIYTTRTENGSLEKKLKEGHTGFDYNLYNAYFTEDGSMYFLCCCVSASDVTKEIRGITNIIGIAFILALVIGVILMILVFHKVLLRPLSIVQGEIRNFTEEKKTEKLVEALEAIKSENEIGQLSSDVSSLVVELKRYTNELTSLSAENEKIETELKLARGIQNAALPTCVPKFDKYDNFEISGQMNPAKEVGGDFFDYFKMDEDHLAIIIGDVDGKGIPAAMFMMLSHICLKIVARSTTDPSQIFEEVNSILTERNDMDMFVTVWLGILDLRTGEIKCANAGHEKPAVYRKDSGFELIKSKHGFVLAGMEGTRYKTETITLGKGDALFIYTDGVPEATNINNEMYGTDRMIDTLNKVSDKDCDTILTTLKKDIDEFVGEAPQFDDLTMVCLRF